MIGSNYRYYYSIYAKNSHKKEIIYINLLVALNIEIMKVLFHFMYPINYCFRFLDK
jgi:hypothetical protein